MIKRIIQCDICGRTIKPNEDRFKFKHYSIEHMPYGGWDSECWKKKDICTDCYKEFISFIKTSKEL